VVVPIAPDAEWKKAKAFTKALADRMAEEQPDLYLARISKAERTGRIFIDYLRNDPTSTAVGAYSTRSRKGAPVSMPIAWDEVRPGLDPCAYTLATVPDIIACTPDPWAGIGEVRQSLGDAASHLSAAKS
jgi:bifunctional non-homologous end joining protein LigD